MYSSLSDAPPSHVVLYICAVVRCGDSFHSQLYDRHLQAQVRGRKTRIRDRQHRVGGNQLLDQFVKVHLSRVENCRRLLPEQRAALGRDGRPGQLAIVSSSAGCSAHNWSPLSCSMKSLSVTSPLTSMLADSPPHTAQSGFCSSSNVNV